MSNEEIIGTPLPRPHAAPTRRARILVAVLIGLTVGVGVLLHLAHSHIGAADFTFTWRAARTILSGQTPYVPIRFDAPYPYYSGFAYPLTAALVGVPFAALSAPIAGSIFFAISTGLLAYAVTRDGYGRLPLFVSAPFINAAAWCTWSPLLTAAALLPALGWAMSVKPNLGLVAAVYRPTRLGLMLAASLTLATLAVRPTWPAEWIGSLSGDHFHASPVLLFAGPVTLLALLRWRRPEARLLLVLACVPHSIFYHDHLPLLLVARTFRETLLLAALSLAGMAIPLQAPQGWTPEFYTYLGPTINLFVFLPATVMVLRRPNEGELPPVLERWIAGARAWRRGPTAEVA